VKPFNFGTDKVIPNVKQRLIGMFYPPALQGKH